MIYLALIQNFALIIALSFIHSLLVRHIRKDGLGFKLLSGILFGSVALLGMLMPMKLGPGLIFDGRYPCS